MKLIVRPMTMADKPAILRVSARIWDGHDYVPLFFDSWVRERGFWVGEVRGRVVAYSKATELAPGEWWLEALRVDPDHRSRGLGKEMSRQVLYRALEQRPVSLRLATADVNRESIHIITEVMGFKPYAVYRFFVGSPGRPQPGPKLVRPPAADALQFLRGHEELAVSRGLLPSTWRFREANRGYLSELRRSGNLFGFRKATSLEGLLILKPHRYRGNDLDVSFVAGPRRAIRAFRAFTMRVARACGSRNLSGMAASERMASALKAMGMKPHPHISAVPVYEYPI